MNKIVVIVIIIFIIVGVYYLAKRTKKYKGGGIVPHHSKYIGSEPEVIPQMYKDFFMNDPKKENEYIKRVIFHENTPINGEKEHFENILFMINVFGDIMACKAKNKPEPDINYKFYTNETLTEKHLKIDKYYNFLINTLKPFIDENNDKDYCQICKNHLKIINIINDSTNIIKTKEEKMHLIYTLIILRNHYSSSYIFDSFHNVIVINNTYSVYGICRKVTSRSTEIY
jgi:hypothetical protein